MTLLHRKSYWNFLNSPEKKMPKVIAFFGDYINHTVILILFQCYHIRLKTHTQTMKTSLMNLNSATL